MITTTVAFSAERPKRVKAETPSVPTPPPINILSIIPAQAEPGARVMMFGSGFGDRISAFLGSTEVPARTVDGKQAEFIIPQQLEPGLYALYLQRADGVVGRAYNFTVLPLRPVLISLTPEKIGSCNQGREREVSAQGRNFSERSQLFFDGAVIPSNLVSPETLVFSVPNVPGGIHQVMVKNSLDNSSVPLALSIETRPEINQIAVGNEYVNYYELNITGKNFNQNSSIYVDGMQIGGRGGQDIAERERLIYVDCTRLVYQRHPYSPVNKDFRVQIVNQGGEGSQVVNVTAP
ncbi:IPT/TIG domain-containing protein [Pelotalea chapellei]|uniref:IPT/TIG domain-containing protein n=1 Tax=Pelotalea chapellei TaxID=44671 RepID=A0ABS5U434_9BACT|nr:IPT/TIG domain-containing protein [Pelotalea chapellei]